MDITELGKTIAYTRKHQKISQSQMSNDIHISRATISGLESGNCVDVGFKKIVKILDYLGVEIVVKEKSSFPVFEELLNE